MVASGTTKAEQRRTTMKNLISAGRRLFADKGYSATSLADIVAATGVTKGALYHHFGSKAGLFRAVIEEAQEAVAEHVVSAAESHNDPWDQFVAGCEAFLVASSDPDIQRIMLIDGPSVLGWNEWRALDEATSERHLGEALTVLIEQEAIRPQAVEPLTHLLSGAMNEMALWLAQSADPGALPAATQTLKELLEGLRR